MTPVLSTENKNSYHYINTLIDCYEQNALRSNQRAGFLSISAGSTYAMEVVLDSQEKSFNRIEETRTKLKPQLPDPETGEVNNLSTGLQLVDEDVDLAELFGNDNSKLANYLEECIGCSLRLKFDWQLQPLNLLGPINGFLDKMNASLDKLLDRINPLRILEDICWALNHFATLCPQDILLVLMSIKMLLKKYLLAMFNIKLDWTVLLGPLLKAIVGALADLLDNIFALLMAPLDCAVAGMRAANDLLRASQDFISSIQGSGQQVSSFFNELGKQGPKSLVNVDLPVKDVSWNSEDPNSFGQLEVDNALIDSPKPDDSLRLPTGFVLTGNSTVASVLDDPNFANATWLEKFIVPVQEAIAWIKETFDKFLSSLHSLEELVGGGISLSLDNIGVLLFLTDIISLILLIYKLITSNLGVKDWCSFLQQNPSVLENALGTRFGNPQVVARGQGDTAELVLLQNQGQNQVGVIKTCVNNRTRADSDLISNWTREIEAALGAMK